MLRAHSPKFFYHTEKYGGLSPMIKKTAGLFFRLRSLLLSYILIPVSGKTDAFSYSITWIQPSGASISPIWMPVRVSYSFFVTGPISVIPLGMQISLP